MDRLLPGITAALLLYHASLGCCWLHGDHGDAAPSPLCRLSHADHATSEDAACDHACHDHACHDHACHDPADGCDEHSDGCPGEHSQEPCPCDLDCHRHCVYLLPERATVEADSFSVALAMVAQPAPFAVDLLASLSWYSLPPGAEVCEALRPHLLHQVLLI
jgi:hypothetical protein